MHEPLRYLGCCRSPGLFSLLRNVERLNDASTPGYVYSLPEPAHLHLPVGLSYSLIAWSGSLVFAPAMGQPTVSRSSEVSMRMDRSVQYRMCRSIVDNDIGGGFLIGCAAASQSQSVIVKKNAQAKFNSMSIMSVCIQTQTQSKFAGSVLGGTVAMEATWHRFDYRDSKLGGMTDRHACLRVWVFG